MEKKTIKCPKCQAILQVTNPQNEPELMITCGNPQCGAKIRLTFDTGKTQLDDKPQHNDKTPGQIVSGNRQYNLCEGENTVGRMSANSKATIQIDTDDLSMSRLHVCITVHKLKSGRMKAVVSDMREADKTMQLPTYVDDEPLMAEDAIVLTNGDVIRMGKTLVKYQQ